MRAENQEAFISMADLRGTTTPELNTMITEVQQKLLEIRSQANFVRPANPRLYRAYKKLIARAKTALRERSVR